MHHKVGSRGTCCTFVSTTSNVSLTKCELTPACAVNGFHMRYRGFAAHLLGTPCGVLGSVLCMACSCRADCGATVSGALNQTSARHRRTQLTLDQPVRVVLHFECRPGVCPSLRRGACQRHEGDRVLGVPGGAAHPLRSVTGRATDAALQLDNLKRLGRLADRMCVLLTHNTPTGIWWGALGIRCVLHVPALPRGVPIKLAG
jgi:hypothetical protein